MKNKKIRSIMNSFLFFVFLFFLFSYCFDITKIKLDKDYTLNILSSDPKRHIKLRIDFYCENIILFSDIFEDYSKSYGKINDDNYEEVFYIGNYVINIPYVINSDIYYESFYENDFNFYDGVEGIFCLGKNSLIWNYWREFSINKNFLVLGGYNLAANYDKNNDKDNLIFFEINTTNFNYKKTYLNIYAIKIDNLKIVFNNYSINSKNEVKQNNNNKEQSFNLIMDLSKEKIYLNEYFLGLEHISFDVISEKIKINEKVECLEQNNKCKNNAYFYSIKKKSILNFDQDYYVNNEEIIENNSNNDNNNNNKKESKVISFKPRTEYIGKNIEINLEEQIENYFIEIDGKKENIDNIQNNIVIGKSVLEQLNFYVNWNENIISINNSIQIENISYINDLLALILFMCVSCWILIIVSIKTKENILKSNIYINAEKNKRINNNNNNNEEEKEQLTEKEKYALNFKFIITIEIFIFFLVGISYLIIFSYYDILKYLSICLNTNQSDVFIILVIDYISTMIFNYFVFWIKFKSKISITDFDNIDQENLRQYFNKKIDIRITSIINISLPIIWILISAEHTMNFNELFSFLFLFLLQFQSLVIFYTKIINSKIEFSLPTKINENGIEFMIIIYIIYKVIFNSTIFTIFVLNTNFVSICTNLTLCYELFFVNITIFFLPVFILMYHLINFFYST